jgi:hypothetical protein
MNSIAPYDGSRVFEPLYRQAVLDLDFLRQRYPDSYQFLINAALDIQTHPLHLRPANKVILKKMNFVKPDGGLYPPDEEDHPPSSS